MDKQNVGSFFFHCRPLQTFNPFLAFVAQREDGGGLKWSSPIIAGWCSRKPQWPSGSYMENIVACYLYTQTLYIYICLFLNSCPWFILMLQETQKWTWCYAASVLSVSGGCSGCAEMGLQDKVGPAHHSVVYSKTSTHPCCTVFALALSGGELSSHVAVVTALGVSRSVWQLVHFLTRIESEADCDWFCFSIHLFVL